MVTGKQTATKPIEESERRFRTRLVLLAFVLFSVFIIGLAYMATTPAESVGLTLSYTAGLSMIVLPCTLPLVFVIVPLCMGENYRTGFIMAERVAPYAFVTLAGLFFGPIVWFYWRRRRHPPDDSS